MALSVIGYSLQTVLVTPYFRELDALAATGWRGLGLGITALPLLCFVDWEKGFGAEESAILMLASLAGTLANLITGSALKFIQLAVSQAIMNSSRVFFFALAGWFIFREGIRLSDLPFYAVIALSVGLFCLQRKKLGTQDYSDPNRGILLSLLGGLAMTVSFSLFSWLCRRTDPLLASYLWELSIGICAFVLLPIKRKVQKQTLLPFKLSKKRIFRMTLAAAPTVLGTGGFAFATQAGPVSVAGALLSLNVFFIATLSAFILGERPPRLAVLGIILCVASIFLLRIS